MLTEEELQDGFRIGDWEVLPGKGVLRRGDHENKPEPKVFAVLMALAKRDTNLVTKQELIDEVWDGRAMSDEPITRCISQLRKSLDDHSPYHYVENVQRRGYRLMREVKLEAPWWSSLIFKQAVLAVLAIGFIAVMVWKIFDSNDPPVTRAPPRSIAVMPFMNISGDSADEYLVLGFKAELVQILQGLDDYTVKSIRGNHDGKELDEIAREFGVARLLLGSLRRSGNDLRITFQIWKDGAATDGDDIEGDVQNLFPLQESLAVMVRDDLVGKSAQILIKSRPSDSAAYGSYLAGMYALEHRGDPGNLEKAIDLFNTAIRLDEEYGPSYLALATVYTLMSTYRDKPVDEMDRLARETIDAGVTADSAIADAAGAIYGYLYKNQKQWAEAEDAYQRAINAAAVDSNAFNWYSRMLASVGRLDDSLALILKALEIDPSSAVVNSRTAMSYAWLGMNNEALEYFERANDLGWSGSTHILGYAFMLIQSGRMQEAEDLGPLIELTARSILGDLDGAMRIAELLEAPGEIFEMDMLFIPELAALRQHPDFMPLLDRLGVTAYWSGMDCTWNGNRVTCPD
jgi:DNA-binding winged helix-turn-helix (wHTH) protein/tetratricopeptide (TPR) repeat protein